MHENGLDLEFYKEAIKRFDDDEAFPALFNDAMVSISTKLGTMSMEDEYKQHVQVSGGWPSSYLIRCLGPASSAGPFHLAIHHLSFALV